jgi:hypothetical protein
VPHVQNNHNRGSTALPRKSSSSRPEATGRWAAPPGELWRHTAPYRGLNAMTESDADFFFGRFPTFICEAGA